MSKYLKTPLVARCTAVSNIGGGIRSAPSHSAVKTNHPIEPSERVKNEKPNVWVQFVQLAAETKSINVGHGFPDYSPPDSIMQCLQSAAMDSEPSIQQYTRSAGHPRLVSAIGKFYSERLNRNSIDPLTEILITIGAYGALFYAAMAYISPGDEAIIIEPFFDCYAPQVRMAGGKCLFTTLKFKTNTDEPMQSSADLKIDFEELESLFSSKTKLLYFNNPNNPTGKVYTIEEITKIANLAKKYNVIVIADEVYEWLVYPGRDHIRIASLPGMWERTITIGSAGKSFSITGWKTGWAIAPKNIISNLALVHQDCIYTCPTITQEAVAKAFEFEIANFGTPKSYLSNLATNELLPKRNRIEKVLRENGFDPVLPEAGYFMLADFSHLHGSFDVVTKEPKDYRFSKWLAEEKGIAAIPASAFYSTPHKSMAENQVRFCFFKTNTTLDKAEEIVRHITDYHQKK